MPAAIPGLNYVESNINNDIISVETPNDTANATLVIGTALKGKKGAITRIDLTNVKSTFGEIPTGSDFETNAVHAAIAIQASTAGRNKDMYIMAVGDSSTARLNLYENQVFPDGDKAYSLDDNGDPIISMEFESIEETEEANQHRVQVRQDASGLPSALIVTLANGYTRAFGVDPYGVRTNVARDVAELTAQINADSNISAVMNVRFRTLLKSDQPVTVLDGEVPYIEVGPTAPTVNQSWGDKLVSIEKLVEYLTATDTLVAGKISQRLTFKPIKDTNPDLSSRAVTISGWRRIVVGEIVKNATTSDLGSSSFTKALALTSSSLAWDQNDAHIYEIAVVFDHGGNKVNVTDFTITGGVLTVNSLPNSATLVPGDKVTIDYKFTAALVEAFVRSDLVQGSDNSFFVSGYDVIFGQAPDLPVEATYAAIKEFQLGDYSVTDADTIRIEFVNPSKAPDPNASPDVRISFRYLPELPAPASAIITGDNGTVVQGSALKGGTSGSRIDKQRFYDLCAEALDLSMMVPFRRIMIAGAWLDDVVAGIDPETGLDGDVLVNWAELLSTKLAFKSRVAAECNTVLGVKPISTARLAAAERGVAEWTADLTVNTDVANTPAALMSALNSYHIDVALGVPFCSDTLILGGNGFIENPAYAVCGAQIDNPLTQSLIRAPMPPYVKRLLVGFPAGAIVGQLNVMRYTSLVVNAKSEMRIADAPTAADARTPLARQIVRDTTFATLKMARDIGETYLGLRRDARTLNMMQSKINRDIGRSLVPDFLTFFNCEIVPVQGGHITGETKLRIALETTVEIRRIIYETNIKLGGEGL